MSARETITMSEENFIMEPQVLLVTPLGDNNHGTIGPVGTVDEAQRFTNQIVEEVSKPEYRKLPTNRWMCVDGRVPADVLEAPETNEADPQTAGGLAITELSAEYMMVASPGPVSVVLAEKTNAIITNGQEVIVHGDTGNQKSGCGCNKHQRSILLENAKNIDIVTPIAWKLGEAVGLDAQLTIDDVTALIVQGGKNAENDDLWDVDPDQKTDIIVAAGGSYVEVAGTHSEATTRIDTSPYAYDEAKFIRDHTYSDGTIIEAFNVSLGCIKKYYFDTAEKNGTSKFEAAQKVMAAILHNGGTAKWLSNDHMQATVVA